MKKRFLLFEYYIYYPAGGINDLKKTFDTIEELTKYIFFEREFERDSYHIYDCELGENITLNCPNEHCENGITGVIYGEKQYCSICRDKL